MKEKDDNDWSIYTEEYMKDIILTYRDGNNSFFIEDNPDGLHANFKAIYSEALRLQPKSILECGCGGAYHLRNLAYLLPETEIHGFDVTEKQLDFGRWFSQPPERVQKNMFVMDLTGIVIDQQFEFVFTQAVIMHMSTENAMKAMRNMKKLSSKYVLMIENPNHHGGRYNWLSMVREVFGDWDISHPPVDIIDAVLILKP